MELPNLKLARPFSVVSTPDQPLKPSLRRHKSIKFFNTELRCFPTSPKQNKTKNRLKQHKSGWKTVYETSCKRTRKCEGENLAISKYRCISYTTASRDLKKKNEMKCVPTMDNFVCKNNTTILGVMRKYWKYLVQRPLFIGKLL